MSTSFKNDFPSLYCLQCSLRKRYILCNRISSCWPVKSTLCTVQLSFKQCSTYTTLNLLNLQHSKTVLIMLCGLDQIPLYMSIRQTVNGSDATFSCRPAGHEVCVCPCEKQIKRRGVSCLVTAHFVYTVIKHTLVYLCLPPTLLQHRGTREPFSSPVFSSLPITLLHQ